MRVTHILVGIVALSTDLMSATSARAANDVLSSDELQVTFSETDGSLSAKVLSSGDVWTQMPTTSPFAVSNVSNPTPTSLQATLTHGSDRYVATIGLTAGASDFTVSLQAPDVKSAYVTLPQYPYPFVIATPAQGYYVQNTTGDGALFTIDDPQILHKYDFMGIPWWGLTDFDKGMMTILDTPYRAGEADNARAALLLQDPVKNEPLTFRYVFFAKAGYVEMARYYRDYFLKQNPTMAANTLAARSGKPGFENLKDGVYAYFWENDARTPSFVRTVHDAGITHAVSTIYYGDHVTSDDDIAAMMTAAKGVGWMAGMYTDPAGNLDNVAPGHWVNDVLTADDPVSFFNAHDGGWDHICTKYKQTQLNQTEGLQSLFATLGLELTYFDTYVSQEAPCLDPGHANHNPLAVAPAPLPSPLQEERGLRIGFLDTIRGASAVGSGEGIAPAWSFPHVDFFEGSMMLRTYGENTQPIPGGGYNDDFMDAAAPPPPGISTDETHRIPLFEIMFHDYIVSTWDWRDTNFQHLATSRKKNLFNALYGTMPMWNFSPELWAAHQAEFVAGYAFQQRSRSLVGFDDMIGHGYLSDDREIQYTDWGSGLRVIANFDSNARTVAGQNIPGLDFIVLSADGGLVAGPTPDGGTGSAGDGGTGGAASNGAGSSSSDNGGCACTLSEPAKSGSAFAIGIPLVLWGIRRRKRARR